jgi:hypothetical protein
MNDFKFKSSVVSEEIKFVEWEIKPNSKIKNGSVLFLYEYKNSKDGLLNSLRKLLVIFLNLTLYSK